MIQLRNIEKSVPTRPSPTYLLRQITLDIQEGEFVTIMGPSGAGKSTLLSLLGLYDHAWTGEYWLTNLRLGVQKDQLRFEGYVTNLFDEDSYTAVARWSDFSTADLFGFVAAQGLAITPAEQRRFGLRMTFDF